MPKAEGNQKAVKETQEQGEQNDGKVDEDAKRKAHEEAEAKRKAEFKAKQAAKKAAEKSRPFFIPPNPLFQYVGL